MWKGCGSFCSKFKAKSVHSSTGHIDSSQFRPAIYSPRPLPRLSVVSRHFKTTGLSWSNCELARVHVQLWANPRKFAGKNRRRVPDGVFLPSAPMQIFSLQCYPHKGLGGGHYQSFFARMCGPNLETCTTFQTNVWEFSYYFLDQSQNQHPISDF